MDVVVFSCKLEKEVPKDFFHFSLSASIWKLQFWVVTNLQKGADSTKNVQGAGVVFLSEGYLD